LTARLSRDVSRHKSNRNIGAQNTMTPTLIIGLGGTGYQVLKQMRTLLKDSSAIQSYRLVCLDTDQPSVAPKAPDIFVVGSVFGGTGSGTLLKLTEVISPINRQTVAEMLQHPDRLYRMSPHTFELFVGEVYRGLGYSVAHTKRSRDGGVDLYLTKEVDGMCHSYVVQCKHSLKKRRRIGVAYARELLGVAMDRATTAAILVTNVLFSADTLLFAKRHASRLFCVDQSGLLALMCRYLTA